MSKKQNKDKPIFGLAKIPDRELLRYSRVEVGQLKSYIQELEYNLEQKDKKIESLTKEIVELKKQRS